MNFKIKELAVISLQPKFRVWKRVEKFVRIESPALLASTVNENNEMFACNQELSCLIV